MANVTKKIKFPYGTVYLNSDKTARIKYDANFEKKVKTNADLIQIWLDKRLSENLMDYVSFRTGTQEASIKLSTKLGSGIIRINVPYAEYQAYSKKIKKRVGKRGTRPWERMQEDRGKAIARELALYSQKLDN